MSSVKILRMTTGEDIICDVVKSDNENTTVKTPFVIIPVQTAPGAKVQLSMTPYMPYTEDKEINLSSDKIITKATPRNEILNSYNKHLGRGIIQPNPGLITETRIPTIK